MHKICRKNSPHMVFLSINKLHQNEMNYNKLKQKTPFDYWFTSAFSNTVANVAQQIHVNIYCIELCLQRLTKPQKNHFRRVIQTHYTFHFFASFFFLPFFFKIKYKIFNVHSNTSLIQIGAFFANIIFLIQFYWFNLFFG